ncbi:hypothetical protein B0H15DRAFT_776824, partial [Mycena belliarum]
LHKNFAHLQQAQATFKACGELNAAEIKPSRRTILVPLTNSLYGVPGTLSDPPHVLVDVGTGCSIVRKVHYAPAVVFYIRKYLGTPEETVGKNQENMGYLSSQDNAMPDRGNLHLDSL